MNIPDPLYESIKHKSISPEGLLTFGDIEL